MWHNRLPTRQRQSLTFSSLSPQAGREWKFQTSGKKRVHQSASECNNSPPKYESGERMATDKWRIGHGLIHVGANIAVKFSRSLFNIVKPLATNKGNAQHTQSMRVIMRSTALESWQKPQKWEVRMSTSLKMTTNAVGEASVHTNDLLMALLERVEHMGEWAVGH